MSRSGERAFSVLDATTGELLSSDLPDLEELKNRLWWIVRQRRRTEPGRATGEVAKETCRACGTVRLGSFRF
ncbi:MAG TPA: hypothetical protein VFY18_06210, partial [Candidatus Limnocylindrales bacterium]|nr:hypothetical protein [Candidatus Limnocylindrales bacterium]